MAVTTEITNTTYADLRGPLVHSFLRGNHLWDVLNSKALVTMDSGYQIERSFAGGAPARGVGGFTGDEQLNMTRRQQIQRYQIEVHRLMAAINIPKKELDFNDGTKGVIRLLKEYPVTFMEATIRDLNAYLLTGASLGLAFQTAELLGLVTLNGLFTSGRGTGVTNGLIDFELPSAQSQTVQNVAKAAGIYHFNQYRAATNWTSNGMRTLRQVYRQCAQYAAKGKGPDIIIMDDDTYANWEESRLSLVRLGTVEGKTETTNMLATSFGLAQAVPDLDLDRTLFTGAAANGVTYFLTSDNVELVMSTKPSLDAFQDRMADQDVITSKFAAQFNTIFTKFPSHGAATQTAV